MRGSSSRSGPAPDPDALRRDRKSDGEWITLQANHDGPVPEWPMPGGATADELAMWAVEWKRPQATEWLRLGLEHEVALYVRTYIAVTEESDNASLIGAVRQQREHLGLSLAGLARNHWKIGKTAAVDSASPALTAANSRLRVVRDDDVA